MNLRGLITSLGAGGSLIAAALCAAALVGGLLAFRGAVDDPAEAQAGDVTVPGTTASSSTTAPGAPAGGETVVATATEPRAAIRPRPRRSGSRPVRPPRDPAPAPAGDSPSGGDETSGEGTGGGAGPGASAPPPATGEPSGIVRKTVESVREAAAPVVEAVPEPVQPTVDQVVDTVEEVAGTVDEVVAPVGGLLPGRTSAG